VKPQRTAGSVVMGFMKAIVGLVMFLVGAIFVYLQFVGVALHHKRSMKSQLTTNKAGILISQFIS
jgi:ascorbate-specific PTS system EIIC-type component UlaA